ncbi:MAG TPA: ATP-binding protein, partial [Bacteroidia bacterium]|nr:ATP-binding protein [Bacteroidia bacterium]HNJ31336.1 ATP-binding protein [Bacteroidia bacterium]
RVIINLVNNAFYAVHERATKSNANKDETKYKPQVSVATHVVNQFLEITITDNGTGIPDAIKDKIYNPFFTSKPTGKGTGLGLSVSFDIIEKQHGGKLKFESEQGVGTVFTISLPLIAPHDLKQNNGDVKKSVV